MSTPKSFDEKQQRVEAIRARQFVRNSAKRMKQAEREDDRDAALRREARYFQQHVTASSTRREYAQEMDMVFDDSPRGGYWVLGPRKTHTPDCVAMANKNWSWQTLRKINPMNRHAGCGCSVIPWRDGAPIGEESMSKEELDKVRMAESRLGGSMGGQDPRKYGKIRHIVRTFGKWAGGKQSICAKRLAVEHPEICRGDCNALCAWLKDQWTGTTKWRGTGPKQKAENAAIVAGAKARRLIHADPPITPEGLEALYELAKTERPLHASIKEAADERQERGGIPRDLALVEYDAKSGIMGDNEMLEALATLDADL